MIFVLDSLFQLSSTNVYSHSVRLLDEMKISNNKIQRENTVVNSTQTNIVIVSFSPDFVEIFDISFRGGFSTFLTPMRSYRIK